MSYVCAFRGRRDGYEVPLALAESGRLARFVTDYYQTGAFSLATHVLPARLKEKLELRVKEGIPADKVECLLGSTLLENVLIRAGRSPAATFMEFDARYSRAAARIARSERTDLFLYSPYAMPAFRERFDHDPRKVLFQFHPHATLERSILAADRERWRTEGLEFSEDLTSNTAPPNEPEYDRGWSYAHHIICASSFTKRSLVEEGASASRISVIPYGVDIPEPTSTTAATRDAAFRVLFVGTGMQRKGLHHLLAAWKQSGLDRSQARLTVVARAIEPSLKRMLEETPGAVLRTDVMQAELAHLYNESSLFCMPSLVEGFGQVYLEALSHGLPVLGTPNTCLPDIGGERDGVFAIEPGDVDALAAALNRLSASLPGNAALREAARDCARQFTWPRFRRRIAETLDAVDTARTRASP
jgi:glycosyltransferase involved in cell wall biosynthesis